MRPGTFRRRTGRFSGAAVWFLLVGRALLAGLVGSVPVVMAGVLAEDRSQVAFVVDGHPVGALGSCCAYPSLGVMAAGQPWRDMLLAGLTVAFATVPEELPILITLLLALGGRQLA